MPKVEKLSRSLRRLTLIKEHYGKNHIAAMQLEYGAFAQAMLPLARFRELSSQISIEVDNLMSNLIDSNNEDDLERFESQLETLVRKLDAQLEMVKTLKRRKKAKKRQKPIRVITLAMPTPRDSHVGRVSPSTLASALAARTTTPPPLPQNTSSPTAGMSTHSASVQPTTPTTVAAAGATSPTISQSSSSPLPPEIDQMIENELANENIQSE